MENRIRCVIMRGGTSKAVFFAAEDLPSEPQVRDSLIVGAFGSPDIRQIDGLGGADPLTSKLAIVAPAARDDADVEYTFGQVGIVAPTINYRVNCGNTAAAVGLYALQEGLARTGDGTSFVTIHCTNSDKRIVAEVPTADGEAATAGPYRISGVPRPGPEIRLRFLDPAGGVTGRLLPTGNAVDEIRLRGGRRIEFSLIDCGNLYAIVPAETWSLDGSELPDRLEAVPGLMAQIEQLRETVCRELLPENEPADGSCSTKLKVAIVGPAVSCPTIGGECLERDSMDIVARVINQERVHKAFAVTGAICFAAAASVAGSVVSRLCALPQDSHATLRIAHPQGLIEPVVESARGRTPSDVEIRSVQVSRTARRIMEGFVYVPTALAS